MSRHLWRYNRVRASLRAMLDVLQQHGSSVTLTWGEDTNVWECAWVTGDRRAVGIAQDPLEAVLKAHDQIDPPLYGV